MAETTPPPDQPSPEEVTQQVGHKPPAPSEITQQTRIKPTGETGDPYLPPHPAQEPLGALSEPVVAASRPSAVSLQPPRQTVFRRLGHALYSKETRFGRFMRGVVATLLTVIVLFAAWAIFAFFLIYRPMTAQLSTLQVDATRTSNQLLQSQSDQQSAEQKAQVASTQSAKDSTRLQLELTHVELLRATNDLAEARLAVAQQDADTASKSITSAETTLTAIYPLIQKQNAKQVETLQALFTVAKNDLDGRDPATADQDLQRLQNELNLVEKNLFQ